jgi:uncharacterized membrane protein (DUF373 family)
MSYAKEWKNENETGRKVVRFFLNYIFSLCVFFLCLSLLYPFYLVYTIFHNYYTK